MSTVADWREELKSTAKTCGQDQAVLVERLRDSKKKLARELKRMGLESNTGAEYTASQKLKHAYYSNWLSSKYPIVDLSFTKRTLDLLVERTTTGAELIGLVTDREPVKPHEMAVTINRFAIQRTDSRRDLFGSMPDAKCVLGRFNFSSFQKNREKYRDYTGNICCNRPAGSPKALVGRLRDIMAIGLEARAAAIRSGVSIEGADFGRAFLWLPRIEDLYISEEIPVRDDPAVLVTCGDRAHLVAFWDSPDEDPIEGLLREFSDGPFVK